MVSIAGDADETSEALSCRHHDKYNEVSCVDKKLGV